MKKLYSEIIGDSGKLSFTEFNNIVEIIRKAHHAGVQFSYSTVESLCDRPTWNSIVNHLDLRPAQGGGNIYVVSSSKGVYISSVPYAHNEFTDCSMLVVADEVSVARKLQDILQQAKMNVVIEHVE